MTPFSPKSSTTTEAFLWGGAKAISMEGNMGIEKAMS
jgi:hypothetical protein